MSKQLSIRWESCGDLPGQWAVRTYRHKNTEEVWRESRFVFFDFALDAHPKRRIARRRRRCMLIAASASRFDARPLMAPRARVRFLRAARVHDGRKFHHDAPRSTASRGGDAHPAVADPSVARSREPGRSLRRELPSAQKTFHTNRHPIDPCRNLRRNSSTCIAFLGSA